MDDLENYVNLRDTLPVLSDIKYQLFDLKANFQITENKLQASFSLLNKAKSVLEILLTEPLSPALREIVGRQKEDIDFFLYGK